MPKAAEPSAGGKSLDQTIRAPRQSRGHSREQVSDAFDLTRKEHRCLTARLGVEVDLGHEFARSGEGKAHPREEQFVCGAACANKKLRPSHKPYAGTIS
jgi:hypothetical protein